MAQMGMSPEMLKQITCVISVAWYTMVWSCDHDSDFVNMAFIRLREAMKMTHQSNNIVYWL